MQAREAIVRRDGSARFELIGSKPRDGNAQGGSAGPVPPQGGSVVHLVTRGLSGTPEPTVGANAADAGANDSRIGGGSHRPEPRDHEAHRPSCLRREGLPGRLTLLRSCVWADCPLPRASLQLWTSPAARPSLYAHPSSREDPSGHCRSMGAGCMGLATCWPLHGQAQRGQMGRSGRQKASPKCRRGRALMEVGIPASRVRACDWEIPHRFPLHQG